MINYPCKDCIERRPGCHDKCQKYLEIKAENEMILGERQRSEEFFHFSMDKHYKIEKVCRQHRIGGKK